MSEPKLSERPRPTAPELAACLKNELLPPYSRGGVVSVDGFRRIPIEAVWDYGPIGLDGVAWLHPRYRLVVVRVDEPDPIIIAPGFTRAQFDRLKGLLRQGSLLPDGWERRGGVFKRREITFRAETDTTRVVVSMALAAPALDASLVTRVTAIHR